MDEQDFDEFVVLQLVSFMLDYYDEILSPPLHLKTTVSDRLKVMQKPQVTRGSCWILLNVVSGNVGNIWLIPDYLTCKLISWWIALLFFLVSKHRKWRDFKHLNIGILKVFVTLLQIQRFWLFSKCHCKNTHIVMDIPNIPACRGISLASDCNFRISNFQNFVDKMSSGNKSLFSSFERFCLPATISTILVIFKVSL